MTIEVQHISASASAQSGYWRVVRDGKVIEKFFSTTAEADARAYADNLTTAIEIVTEVQDAYNVTAHPQTDDEREIARLRAEIADLTDSIGTGAGDHWTEQKIENLDRAISEIQARPAFWTCAVYLVDKAYGGPEEGGWWYTCGVRQDSPIADLPPSLLAFTIHDEAAALRFATIVQAKLDAGVNKGRRSISSMASDGRYEAEVHRGYPPASYPERRPHYE